MTPVSSEWTEVFTDFHDRHRDSNHKKLRYTVVFNAAMDAFIGCPDVPLTWQVLALIWRTSWGNNSDFCVAAGKPAGQKDLAERLRVDKRRISEVVGQLETLNFLLPSTGHKLYPCDDPLLLGTESTESPESKSPAPSGLFQEFCEEWKVRSLADFQELQSAEETVFRLKKVRLGEYREWRRARTFTRASLYTTSTQQQQESVGRSVEVEEPPEQPTDRPTDTLQDCLTAIEESGICQKVADTPTPDLLARTAAALGGAAPKLLTKRIMDRWETITSLGILPRLAADVARASREKPPPAPVLETDEQQAARVDGWWKAYRNGDDRERELAKELLEAEGVFEV